MIDLTIEITFNLTNIILGVIIINTLHIFSASWCGPCKIYKSVYEPMNPVIHKIDTDEGGMDLARDLGIRGVPTTMIMNERDEVVVSETGVMSNIQLQEFMRKHGVPDADMS